MTELNEINKQALAPHLLHCYSLKAKYSFYNICSDKAIQYIKRNSSKLGNIFEDMHKAYFSMFEEVIFMIFSIDKNYNDSLKTLQQQLEKANQQTSELLEASEKLEKDCEKHVFDKKSLKAQFDEDRNEYNDRIKDLIDENKRYLDILIKNSKNCAENAMSLKKYSIPQQAKNLNLRQMKEIIQEIYESKTKYDKKSIFEGLSRETMEKHMYTYLNNKYGLKTLIIE